jgi:hypothetical protein
MKIDGEVMLEATVGTQGKVKDVKPASRNHMCWWLPRMRCANGDSNPATASRL